LIAELQILVMEALVHQKVVYGVLIETITCKQTTHDCVPPAVRGSKPARMAIHRSLMCLKRAVIGGNQPPASLKTAGNSV
jgi:hypothetical protein